MQGIVAFIFVFKKLWVIELAIVYEIFKVVHFFYFVLDFAFWAVLCSD